jgi:hypothetical protein
MRRWPTFLEPHLRSTKSILARITVAVYCPELIAEIPASFFVDGTVIQRASTYRKKLYDRIRVSFIIGRAHTKDCQGY